MYHDLNHHEVENRAPEDHPPQDGVGPGEGSVRKGQNGYHHEVDEHASKASPHVAPEVGRVPVHKMKDFLKRKINARSLLVINLQC